MNHYLFAVACIVYVVGPSYIHASSTNTALTTNVTSNSFPWTSQDNTNFGIPIPQDFKMAFSAHFSANPAHDFHIGLYSPNFVAQCALGPYTPSAVVELYIGGWDAGTNSTQRSAVYFGIYTETGYYRKRILFTDTATPRQRYIIPGPRGSYIEYTYTLIASSTECHITLEYLDPSTAQKCLLLEITQEDFAPDILAIIQSPTFAGFTQLGFHTHDAPYNVRNALIAIPQTLIDDATTSLNTARAALPPTLKQNVQSLYEQVSTAIASINNLPDNAVTKQNLLSSSTALQTTIAQDLSLLTAAQAQCAQTPTYATPQEALTAKAATDSLPAQLLTIAQNYTNNAAALDAINAGITAAITLLNAPSLATATATAQSKIGQALTALQATQSVIQESNNKAQSALNNALMLPASISNRSALIAAAQHIQTDPTTGTICYLNYLATALVTLTSAPATYASIADAQTMASAAATMQATAITIAAQNDAIQAALSNIQANITSAQSTANLIAQTNALTAANAQAQQDIQNAIAAVIGAQRLLQYTDTQAGLAIAAVQNLPPFTPIDLSSLIATAQALQCDQATGTTALLNALSTLLQTLRGLPATFTLTSDAQNAQQIAADAQAKAEAITAQNNALTASINNVKSMTSDISNVINHALLNNATITANAHLASAIATVENAQILTSSSDQQVEGTIAIIKSLPDEIIAKSDFLTRATKLLSPPQAMTSLSSALALLLSYTGTYSTMQSAQEVQKMADDTAASALTIARQNQETLTALYALQEEVASAQAQAANTVTSLALATTTANAHVSAALITIRNAQLIAEDSNDQVSAAAVDAQNLPSSADSKQNLLMLISSLFISDSVQAQLASGLDTLSKTPTTFNSIAEALSAQTTADTINAQGQEVINQNPNIMNALSSAKQAIAQAQSNTNSAALLAASAQATTQVATTTSIVQQALSLADQLSAGIVAATTTAQALPTGMPEKQSFLMVLASLSLDQAARAYLSTSLNTLQSSPQAFSSLTQAQSALAVTTEIGTAAQVIFSTIQNNLNSLTRLRQSINSSYLSATTDAARTRILAAVAAFENALTIMQSTNRQVQDTIAAAQQIPSLPLLASQAQQLSANPNNGTQALLTVITNSLTTLQGLPTTFLSIADAASAQSTADALYSTAQQILSQNTTILQNIATLNGLIATAQQAPTPPPSQAPGATPLPQQTPGATPLEKLNITIGLELTAAQQALTQAQNNATQAYNLITETIKTINAAPSTDTSFALLASALSLESGITTILNKIIATQVTLTKQVLPFTSQALALKAKAIVESSASYAKTAVSLIAARMQSIIALQSQFTAQS